MAAWAENAAATYRAIGTAEDLTVVSKAGVSTTYVDCQVVPKTAAGFTSDGARVTSAELEIYIPATPGVSAPKEHSHVTWGGLGYTTKPAASLPGIFKVLAVGGAP